METAAATAPVAPGQQHGVGVRCRQGDAEDEAEEDASQGTDGDPHLDAGIGVLRGGPAQERQRGREEDQAGRHHAADHFVGGGDAIRH